MTKRPPSWPARAFRVLLRAYPAAFRRAHGAEMEQLFLARFSRARGVRARLRLWGRTAADTLANAPALRRRHAFGTAPAPRAGGLDMFRHDVRFAFRHLVRTPVFTLGALALLAVGIGANVAVFTVVDRVLLRPLPYAEPDEVVHVHQDTDDGEPGDSAFPAYRDMAGLTDVFTAVAATSGSSASWDRPAGAEDVVIEYTTSSYLDVVGHPMSRGRWFSREEDEVGGHPAAVVSALAWRARFGGDPGVVSRAIRLNGRPVTIVGVGPEDVSGSYPPLVTDFWLSIGATVVGGDSRVANLDRREDHWYDVRARLAPGVTPARAGAALHALALRLADAYPALDRGRDITLQTARDVNLYPETEAALAGASILVALLLILAGANLANLLLVRGLARSGEVAVRRALGAGAGRVARLYLVESLMLAGAGGAAGLLLARAALAAIHLAPLPFPFSASLDLAIDARVACFAAGLMMATGVLFGLAPALRSARADVAAALREDRRQVGVGRGTARLRQALVVVQVAGSFLLILAAGLLARSLLAMQHADPGVDAGHLAWIRTSPARAGLSGPVAAQTLDDIRERIAALPGVTGAAIASRLPAQSSGTTSTIVEGYDPATGTDAVELPFTIVSPEYFDTAGLARLDGRGFGPADAAGAPPVVLVNEAAARRFWGGERPVGRRLRSQSQPDLVRTVIGVVRDAPVQRYPERTTPPMFYIPAGQASLGTGYILARTTGQPETALAPMRAAVGEVREGLPILSQGTMAGHLGEALATPRFMAQVVGSLSLLALTLAAIGIYAAVAFNVARRSSELGLRIALGAVPARVVRMIVGETIGAVGLGLAAGLLIALAAMPRLGAGLYGVQPTDPLSFAAAVLFLTLVAAAAAWLPARRAGGMDPLGVLRQ